mmetsp:Transcript_15685/g.24069  ORF Transcript_15685/g.24069 Transcript_15685/m.24069 type:complete len:80 (+) Transcript_15685:392-631(+)
MQRALTEYELLGCLIGDSDEEEEQPVRPPKKKKKKIGLQSVKDLKNVSFKNVLNSNNQAKQFGTDRCESLSKLSKIVGQ